MHVVDVGVLRVVVAVGVGRSLEDGQGASRVGVSLEILVFLHLLFEQLLRLFKGFDCAFGLVRFAWGRKVCHL